MTTTMIKKRLSNHLKAVLFADEMQDGGQNVSRWSISVTVVNGAVMMPASLMGPLILQCCRLRCDLWRQRKEQSIISG